MISGQSINTEIIYSRPDYTIRGIILADQVAHLTFSRQRHLLAVDWLQTSCNIRLSNSRTELSQAIRRQLDEYFAGRRTSFSLSVTPLLVERGTAFQQRVWQLTATIPYGEKRTYGQLATALGSPGAARAVGQALNANPIALIVPCHRVVAARGVGGFAGGEAAKKALLQLEERGK